MKTKILECIGLPHLKQDMTILKMYKRLRGRLKINKHECLRFYKKKQKYHCKSLSKKYRNTVL